jgi:class 3 adenylate cyclase
MAPETAQRKLTTIVAADVVGYSKLMSVDEDGTLARLRAYRKVTDDLIARHTGRIFNTAGDAFLAEFGSAVEAVRCAIAIQEDLRVRNSELPEGRQMWFRIGVNVGDVMVEDSNLFGDAVNVAARLEGLAETGGICIFGSTFDQVKNKLSIAFKDIGAQQVKNIPEPVRVFRIVPGNVSVRPGAAPPPGQGRRREFAVLGLVLVTVLVAGAWFAGLLPFGEAPANPYDGLWKISIFDLSGCLNDTPRGYTVTVRHGKIDEPTELFPKKGLVTPSGVLSIKAIDRSGNVVSTQTATVVGDTGIGHFQGRTPACTGKIAMVRLQ